MTEDIFSGYDQRAETEFSQAPFWFWNDALDADEIKRQMDAFRGHGIYGVVIHPRAGLPREISWMSEAFLGYVRCAIEHAAATGMWIVLYDEAMYPSGSSGGQVVAENPAYATRGLVQVDLTSARPGDIIQRVRVGQDGVDLSADQTLVAEVTRQHDGHRLAIVDLPIGARIRGVHFVEEDPPRRADHKEVPEELPPAGDLLNPEAMQCFIRLVYQRYYDAFAAHFGRTIKAVFTDEPHLMGRGHYPGLDPRPGTTGILDHVNAFLGYDFTPHLPALWDDAEPEARQHRAAYQRALRYRMQQTYYKPISDWCGAHGIALTGHPAQSDDIGLLKYFEIPGQDVVLRYIEPGQDSARVGAHSTMAKCAASAMVHAGRRRNANEFAGAYGHDLTYAEYRWLALWLLVRGCNMLFPHAFYYSTRGPRVDERPRDVGPHSPWWGHYKDFAALTGKLCWLNTDSQPLCEVAILGLDAALPWEAARICFESQIDFHYLEQEYLLSGATITDAGICVAGLHYTTLVVEAGYDTTLGPEAAAVLARLEQAGRLVRWSPQDGAGALRERLPAAVAVTPAHRDLRVRRVRKADRLYAIIFNEGETPFQGTLALAGPDQGLLVDMDRGEHRPWRSTDRIELAPHTCVVVGSPS